MNKAAIIALIVAVAGSAAAVYAKQHPGNGAAEPACGLYSRCVGHDGVEATFVEAMRLNDSVTLDVTTVCATNDAGWQWMCDDLQLVPAVFSDSGRELEISHLSPVCQPERAIKYSEETPCDLVVVSTGKRAVYVYHNYRAAYRQDINNLKDR